MVNASAGISTVLAPAGLDKSVGVISTAFVKLPSDPAWVNDDDMKNYLAFMKAWAPQEPLDDCVSSHLAASVLQHVLHRVGNNLTREIIMKAAKSLDNLRPPLLLPGITLTTTPQDVAAYRRLRLRQFDGQKWVLLD